MPDIDASHGSGAGGLLTDAATAAQLDREAASWPELVPAPGDLSDLELALTVGTVSSLTLPAPGVPQPGERLAVRDPEGVLIATLDVTAAADGMVSGEVRGVRLPSHPDAAELRRTPSELAVELLERGWQRVAAVLTDRPLHTADLDRLRHELDGGADGVVVALLAGGNEATDPAHHARIAALRAGMRTLPEGAALLTILPLSPGAAPELREQVAAAYGLGNAFVEPAAGTPTDAEVTSALDDGTALGADRTPPEVEAVLRRGLPPRSRRGFTVLFTGLSGSGKSTVAGLLAVRLMELTDRRVLLLDGDRVRRNLTAGLGFSRADRDTNVRRIGWVAAQVAAAGGIAVCAPIAPYDGTRRAVRAMVEGQYPPGGFVLVHIATPLAECERRDRKGLYAKARAGLLPEFTGISDPYEVPTDADVVADTTGRSPADIVDEVVTELRAAGWL